MLLRQLSNIPTEKTQYYDSTSHDMAFKNRLRPYQKQSGERSWHKKYNIISWVSWILTRPVGTWVNSSISFRSAIRQCQPFQGTKHYNLAWIHSHTWRILWFLSSSWIIPLDMNMEILISKFKKMFGWDCSRLQSITIKISILHMSMSQHYQYVKSNYLPVMTNLLNCLCSVLKHVHVCYKYHIKFFSYTNTVVTHYM